MRVRVDVPFATIPEWVLFADISPQAVRLYATLQRFASNAGEARPSRQAIADKLHVASKDTVDRALKELIGIGAVVVEHQVSPEGDLTANLYHVRTAPPVASATEDGSRTDAAGWPQESGEGSRTDTARGGRTDAAGNERVREYEYTPVGSHDPPGVPGARAAPPEPPPRTVQHGRHPAAPIPDTPDQRAWFGVVVEAISADAQQLTAALRTQVGQAAADLCRSGADIRLAPRIIELFRQDNDWRGSVKPRDFVTFWPVGAKRARAPTSSPLDILRRRYAKGGAP